ncbi:unnamed protein product [Lymnaea stagnalis]|uniref:RWD domain-containing protein n=1 Tax=Lymnaea stagnalis TaxID=6523 RepID=A0AAV2IAJ2_LYMST
MAATISPSTTSSANSGSNDTTNQAREVASIKAAFPNRCRVICDIGNYTNVVTVQPENLDVTIKFQLTSAYPSVIPEISIRSESLSPESILDVQQKLRSHARKLIGQLMIQTLIQEAEVELRAVGLKPGKAAVAASGKTQPKKRKQKKKRKSEEEEDENKKLPSMKTADDVVKRIIWDDNLEKDDFIVGYVDRFKGLVEKSFSDFTWEDLASLDNDVLAVPKHRIQYFKYKTVKVWDKTRRIDNVFGSAEGTKTIDVVMKEFEEMGGLQPAGGAVADRTNSNSETDADSSDDSDDDDGIMVTIGPSASIGTDAKNRAQQKQNEDDKIDRDNEERNGFNPYWRDKLRPNYFLCVRISNDDIMDKICNIQDRLMEAEPLFSECCIPGVALHVTLNTLGLDTPEHLIQCVEALKKMKPELESALPKSVLKLQGVSNFYNRVVYAQVQYQKDFLDFCNLLKTLLSEAGVQIRDGYEFVPHVTIMKTTRPVSRLRGTKNVNPQLYSKYVNTEFGEQKIDSIYLCSMGDDRREDGFYKTPLELHFNA